MNLHPSEQAIFAAALERDTPESRAAYLDDACRGNDTLRREVEALLLASDQAGTFLGGPLTTVARDGARAPTGPDGGPEAIGAQIGRYKLLEPIGEGGCGVVYMAEQQEPVQRRVALKVIKLGMDTRSVVARFEAERQALALMDHPNIARVFDGGTTPAGRPYFVMELVRGARITDYCAQHRLALADRLRLFVLVCHAIQHAHQKGVIHRDIKPSNILVTVNDGAAVPKVIDFGIAKATAQRLTEKTLFTHFHSFIGTPAYTSPEQAGMSSVDVDTRSDIYSLGVLLYELLTGRTPFDGETLLRSGLDEMRRIIRDVEPPRPSTVLHRRAPGSPDPSAAPGRLSLPSDLDWIVMKCLEKDRARRYGTAAALAADVQRHLDHEPVLARPPGFGYRAGKWALKHKGPAVAVAAIGLALSAGAVVSTTLYLREQNARAAESLQRAKAELESARSAATARFLEGMLSGINPDQARGRDVTVLTEMLEDASVRVERELGGQPEVEAGIRRTIGHLHRALAQYAKAQVHLERSRALLEQRLGPDHPETLQCVLELVDLYGEQGRLADAETLCRQAFERSLRAAGPADPLTLDLQQRVALACLEQRKFAEAERLLTECAATRERILGRDHLETLKARGSLAAVLLQQRAFARAEAILRETVPALQQALPPDHPGALQESANLAAALHGLGRLDEAEALYRETLEAEQRIHGAEHQRPLIAMQNLGTLISTRGRHGEAVALLRQAAGIGDRTLGPDHPRTLRILDALSLALARQKQFDEAESIARRVLASNQRVLGPEHARTLRSLVSLADILAKRGSPLDESEQLYRDALAVQNRTLGPTHGDSLLTAGNLLLVLRRTKKSPAVELLCRETLAECRRQLGEDHPATKEWTRHLASASEDPNRAGPARR